MTLRDHLFAPGGKRWSAVVHSRRRPLAKRRQQARVNVQSTNGVVTVSELQAARTDKRQTAVVAFAPRQNQ